MVDSKQNIENIESGKDAVDKLLHEREVNRINTAFHNSIPSLFAWAIVFSVFLIVLIYFILPTSKVKVLSIKGNNYLDKNYIEKLSGVNYSSRYFLVFPHTTANKIKQDPQIKDAIVRLLPEHVVQIEVVEEQPLGYRYEEKGPVILLESGNKVELTSEKMTMVSRIPYIDGFYEDEQTSKLINALKVVKPTMLEEITEIRQYNLDYDEETMMIQMREGGYFFTNYYLIDSINYYHDMFVRLKDKNACIYADANEKVVGARACPWDEVPVLHEYWVDDNGDYLINKFGDRAVKHYYHDDHGNFYLDDEGNKIVIPIDENVEDIVDDDFLEHYLKGYYATGKLEIPEEDEEDKEKTEEEKTDTNQENTDQTNTENTDINKENTDQTNTDNNG